MLGSLIVGMPAIRPALLLVAASSMGCTFLNDVPGEGGENSPEDCRDSIDNDFDGVADCQDLSCARACRAERLRDGIDPPEFTGGCEPGFHAEGLQPIGGDSIPFVCVPGPPPPAPDAPPPGFAACTEWAAHLPGDAGCESIDFACDDHFDMKAFCDRFEAGCPAGNGVFRRVVDLTGEALVLFINSDPKVGSDDENDGRTEGQPVLSLRRALAIAAEDGERELVVLSLASSSMPYEGTTIDITPTQGVVILGACPEKSRIGPVTTAIDGIIDVEGARLSLWGVSIASDGVRPGIATDGERWSAGVEIDGVVITDGAPAIHAKEAQISVTRLLVRDAPPAEDTPDILFETSDPLGDALLCCQATIADSLLDGGGGIEIRGESTLRIEGTRIRAPRALTAAEGAQVTLEGVLVEGAESGIAVFSGAVLDATDLAVTGAPGIGLQVEGARATVREAMFEDAPIVVGDGGALELANSYARLAQGTALRAEGEGTGASIVARAVLIEAPTVRDEPDDPVPAVGIEVVTRAGLPGTEVDLQDVAVRELQVGLRADSFTVVRADRFRIENSHTGIVVQNGARVLLQRTDVDRTQPASDCAASVADDPGTGIFLDSAGDEAPAAFGAGFAAVELGLSGAGRCAVAIAPLAEVADEEDRRISITLGLVEGGGAGLCRATRDTAPRLLDQIDYQGVDPRRCTGPRCPPPQCPPEM